MCRILHFSLPAAAFALLLAGLAGCGDSGGNASNLGSGPVIPGLPPPPEREVEEGDVENTPLPVHEDFGNFAAFDQNDTIFFFSPGYKALATDDPDDPRPAFYYPTCCFFEGGDPDDEITVDHENRLGIVNDSGDSTLLISDARFSIAQTRSPLANPGATDPKVNSTPGSDDDSVGWGELDLTEPYRISFCVKAASGSESSLTQVYVNNNTTSEASSIHGGGNTGSRLFSHPTPALIPGQRVEISVPGEATLQPGGTPVSIRTQLTGTSQSFLQLRVSSGGSAIIDDFVVEYQDAEPVDVPACTPFAPAEPPGAMEAPQLTALNGAIAASWPAVLGAASYDLAVNTADSPEGATLAENITETQFTVDGLDNGTQYFVFVRAVNSAGTGDWSPSATATPMAPEGCTPTQQVMPSPGNNIQWNVYDGCLAPGEPGAIVLDGSMISGFEWGDEDHGERFTANDDGTSTLDTEGSDRSHANLSGVIAGAPDAYPKHFTLLARIDTPRTDRRGFEIELSLGDESQRRVKTILRPDQGGDGRIQLERFLNGGESSDDTANADIALNTGPRIFHIAFVMNGPEDIDATVYVDGQNVSALFEPSILDGGTGRSGGSANRLRIGEDSSSGHFAVVDWLIWSNDPQVSGLTPQDLVDELPEGIGELGVYSSAAPGCTPTQQVDPSPTHGIVWDVYDGCLAPGAANAIVLNGNEPGAFQWGGEDHAERFTASGDGTATLDTEGSDRSHANLSGVIAGAPDEYPKHFTLLARIDTPDSGRRGFEIEVSFGDFSERRVKTILRPDQGGDGRMQLERFLNGGESSDDTANADIAMDSGFRIYHVTFTMNGPEDIDATVFVDGEDVSALFEPSILDGGTGRGGGGANRLRIGEDSSSGHFAHVDWIVWSNGATAAGLAPPDLTGELPASIGELGVYGGGGQ